MKRKIALLLATVMTLSLVPMNVFAASSNELSDPATVVPEKTVLVEDAVIGNKALNYDDDDDLEYVADGTDLVIELKDEVQPGDSFRLELENAKWFFRSDLNTPNYMQPLLPSGQATSVSALYHANKNNVTFTEAIDNWETETADEKWTDYSNATGYGPTYNVLEGVWGYDTDHDQPDDGDGENVTIGTYVRYDLADGSGNAEIPYALTISPLNDAYATVEILADGGADMVYTDANRDGEDDIARVEYDDTYQIRIPLVSRTTKDADVKVKVIPDNQTAISTGTNVYSIAGKALTNTYVEDPKTARDEFEIEKLVIKESRINGIVAANDDSVYITAPSGFEFNDPQKSSNNVRVGVDRGLQWGNNGGNSGTRVGYGVPSSDESFSGDEDYCLDYKQVNYDDDGNRDDESVLKLTLRGANNGGLVPSKDLQGAIYIEGLVLYADENAPFGDVMLSIKNVNDPNTDDLATEQTFKAGIRTDWTISLQTKGVIPQLINGRYESETAYQGEDEYHKTATVVFKENAQNAWWSNRETVFTLPDGVKFRKVEFLDSENLEEKGNSYELDDVVPADGKKHENGHVKIDGNTMTWTNLEVKQNEKAMVEMDIWVSIESGFKGDVTLSVDGNAIPEQGGAPEGNVPSIVIATQMSPVTVKADVTDIKVGYQDQKTADIMITETKAGNLMKGKTVSVSVTDLISSDMAFSPTVDVAVTDGDLKITNIRTNSRGFASSASGSSLGTVGYTANDAGTISFDIKTPSSKASTITLSNVSVKIDRTIPYTNERPYDVVVWNTAIAQNYGTNKDEFNKAGVATPYVKVVTSATGESSILTQEVRVTEGESYYTVNGVPYDMDATAYISPASNSMMVPIRFVSNAFGLRDDQIIWDDQNDTVTLLIPGRTVQYKVGSSTEIIDGVSITMFSPDGLEVMPENVGDRVYVPFRAVGDAFGVTVGWDAATRTAIYNPGAALEGTEVREDAVAATPAATAAATAAATTAATATASASASSAS